jgi:hypothetical protein
LQGKLLPDVLDKCEKIEIFRVWPAEGGPVMTAVKFKMPEGPGYGGIYTPESFHQAAGWIEEFVRLGTEREAVK